MKTAAYILITALSSPAFVMAASVTLIFVAAIIVTTVIIRRFRRKSRQTRNVSRLMEHALDVEQIVVVKVIMSNARIINVHGSLLPEEGISTRAYLNDVHPDDRSGLSRLIREISLGMKSTGEYHYRRKTSDSEGNETWRYVHNNAVKDGRSVPYDVICTLHDETADTIEQQQEEDLSRRYQSIFRRSIMGLSIYDKRGMLLAANEDLRQMLHFEGENDPEFYNTSLFNRRPFRDLIREGEATELHFCTKLIIPERGIHTFVEILLQPLLDEEGHVLHYSLSMCDISHEHDFYIKNRQNDKEIQKANEKIQRYETELQYLMDRCDMRVWKATFSTQEVTLYKSLNSYERKMTLPELRYYFLDNVEGVNEKFSHPELAFNKPFTLIRRMRSIFHNPDEIHWNIIDAIPIFDKNGKLEGSFGVIRNITPLIQAQELLKEETRRANDSTRLKSVFMANMTHEIRTPLNAIVGFSDLLPTIDNADEKKELIRIIRNNCDMLLRLINDILEISTMDSNAIIINTEEVDFARVFDDICESLRQRVQNPAVEFIKDNPYTSLMLAVDKRRIQQVITNFVTNAVKYTQEGHIRVGYRVEEREETSNLKPQISNLKPQISNLKSQTSNLKSQYGLYIYCEDTGAGIPKEKQGTVFDRFVKLNDYVQGTGLGLSICKAIAMRCGGEIGVDSEGEGKGSTFWMRIPL